MNKKEWDYFPEVWSTEAKYLSWLRGNIRRIWSTSPQKNIFLKKNRKKIFVYDDAGQQVFVKKTGLPKQVWGYSCAICGAECKESGVVPGTRNKPLYAVDHIKGGHSLRSLDDIQSFVLAIVNVRLEDLQILCHVCHDIKTLSEKLNVSFQQASFEKIAIKIIENNLDKQFFIDRQLAVPKNVKLRRSAIVNILQQEEDKN